MVIIDKNISAIPAIEIHIFNIAGDIDIQNNPLFTEVIITQIITQFLNFSLPNSIVKKTERKRGETLPSV